MPKCEICDLTHLPICAGTCDPTLCVNPSASPDANAGRRRQQSLWLSSQAGWPAVVVSGDAPPDVAAFHNPYVAAQAADGGGTSRVAAGSGLVKPVVPLGVPQRR